MPDRPRNSSTQVTLVLLGAAALASCNAPEPARRVYATKEACIADWGDPRECEEQFATQTDGARRSYFARSGGWSGSWGGSSGGTRGGAHPGGTVRGGFGASGHAHSGGG